MALLRQSLDDPSSSSASKGAGAKGHSRGGGDHRSYVPEFTGTTEGYKEYRKKVELYAARARTKESENSVGLDLMQGLRGRAWDAVEDLDVAELEKDKGWELVLKRLDSVYKYDARTEMPTEFENFFMKLGRKPRETLLEFTTRFHMTHRKIKGHGVDLPRDVLGWLLMRKAGITKAETTAILSQVGKNLDVDKVEEALKLTLGLDSLPSGKADIRWVEDYTGEEEAYSLEDYDPAEEAYAAEDYTDAWYEEQDTYTYCDEDEAYYDSTPTSPGEAAFSVETYDDIMAAYTDARKQMNDMRLSRGFYPVVAMIPSQVTSHRSDATRSVAPPKPRGKGGKKGKGKSSSSSKGPSKGKFPGKRPAPSSRPPGPIFGPRPSMAPRSAAPSSESVCLRCGETGHWARDCPQQSRKRPHTGDGMDVGQVGEIRMIQCDYTNLQPALRRLAQAYR